jgi:hypothetical protein
MRPPAPSLLLFLWLSPLPASPNVVTVAAGGKGQFDTVQKAVDSIPAANSEPVVISIASGTFQAPLVVRRSNLTFRGQGRAATRIEWAVDTSACPEPGSKEEHCATVLVDASDIAFEHLTVANPYRGNGKGAALSVAGSSTRITVRDVAVEGFGGDTLVLSSRGFYYLENVSVSGTYHIIVPRGTAYFTGCSFQCLGHKTCLFHEGITRETDKLVIRDSTIEGPEPFGLGSYFRDAAWYFLNVSFAPGLRDQPIFRQPAAGYQMKWGEVRVYFSGCRGPDYGWLKDNLDQSPARSADRISLRSVFPDWDPPRGQAPR